MTDVDHMNYRHLGKTGVKVSELCLGAMTFGRENEATEEESFQMMDRFVAAGGNFIDTANVYSTGISEEIVGRWLKQRRRDDLVIATKVRFPMGEGPNDLGLSRKHILSSVEASLRRLQTDYIDLYQVHCWDPKTPLEETLSTLNDLVRKGVVRYVGASNFAGWQLQRAIDISRENRWEGFVCLQPQYNLLCRSTEWELVPLAVREGLGVIPWSPQARGKLTRDWNYTSIRTETDEAFERLFAKTEDADRKVVDRVARVAAARGIPRAQVALAWLLAKPVITAPIVGATKLEVDPENGTVG